MAFASLADELDLDGPGYDYDDEYEYDRGVGVSLADELLDGPDDLGRGGASKLTPEPGLGSLAAELDAPTLDYEAER
ncbi:hypothetical protein A1Q2_00993 [Trichosporon asahii var. asahii CBS 8904]|uniref:Uncharacterized protein n=2 Tax=Trichosporon asahii var. asahii TaxID=189963 RepID=K1W7A6_TRIAC|nr:hypothetical protein A1Q2_00993 [Trichosporon asahii var. asahii CBS 8904]